METRSLIFHYEAGEIKAISLNADLDSIYKKMFQNSRRSARRNPLDIDHGIKIIIFGCFWLEALCNNLLKKILKLESKKIEFGDVIWNKLKRGNFFDKLEIISTFTTRSQREQYLDLLPKLRKVIDLRNRLAHFKDKDEKLTDAVCIEEAMSIVANVPVPSISKVLMWPIIGEYAEIISKTNIWLNLIYKSFCRIHGIRISNCEPKNTKKKS